MANIVVLSDSFLNIDRMKSNIQNDKLVLVPHKRKDNKPTREAARDRSRPYH